MARISQYDPRVRVRDTVRAAETLKNYLKPDAAHPRVVHTTGKCPRCNHETHDDFPLHVVGPKEAGLRMMEVHAFPDLEKALDEQLASQELEFDERCQCAVAHPKTPKDKTGCGAPFSIRVKWPKVGATDNEAMTLPAKAAPSADDLGEEELWQTASLNQLADVRKAAESWRNGLAALLALVATIFFIKGRESVFDIDKGWRQLLAALLLVAFAATVWGAWQAMKASFGQYGQIDWAEVEEQGGWSGYQASLAEGSAKHVESAQRATLVALTALALAVLITWFAPKPPSAAATLSVVRSGETVPVCGEFTGISGGNLNIKDAEPIPLAKVISLSVVDSCGAED